MTVPPIDSAVFTLTKVIPADTLDEVPLPGTFDVSFLPTAVSDTSHDYSKLDVTIVIFNTMDINGMTMTERMPLWTFSCPFLVPPE